MIDIQVGIHHQMDKCLMIDIQLVQDQIMVSENTFVLLVQQLQSIR